MKQIKIEQEFRDQIAQNQLTVGIFTANWCPDCKRLDMFIDEITAEHPETNNGLKLTVISSWKFLRNKM